MRKLFLFLVVLFLSFQQVTLAAIKEMTSTPDSVYLFSFATSGDDGRSGLRFAWSMDKPLGITEENARPLFETVARWRMDMYLEIE